MSELKITVFSSGFFNRDVWVMSPSLFFKNLDMSLVDTLFILAGVALLVRTGDGDEGWGKRRCDNQRELNQAYLVVID
jgi:hypothetical protein